MIVSQPPSMSPSPQTLTLYLFQCSHCAHAWLEFIAESNGCAKCPTKEVAIIQAARVQVFPPARIEIPPLIGVKSAT